MRSGIPEKKEDLNLQSVLADLSALVLKGKQLEALEAELQAAKATCANQAAQLAELAIKNLQLTEQVESLNSDKAQLQQTLEERRRQEEPPESLKIKRDLMVAGGRVPGLEAQLKEKREALELARPYLNDRAMSLFFGPYPPKLKQALETNNQEAHDQTVAENKRDQELARLNEQNGRLCLENADLKFQLQKANEIVNNSQIQALLSM